MIPAFFYASRVGKVKYGQDTDGAATFAQNGNG